MGKRGSGRKLLQFFSQGIEAGVAAGDVRKEAIVGLLDLASIGAGEAGLGQTALGHCGLGPLETPDGLFHQPCPQGLYGPIEAGIGGPVEKNVCFKEMVKDLRLV